ncbi:MAG: hypothetical protein KDE53_35390 [Caldilineaceae bacterium]|nr:hypothetical protein [Caldilineaceae bacterium]
MRPNRTTVRVPDPLYDKWQNLSRQLGIPLNGVINVLLENAEVVSRPAVSVKVQRGEYGRHSVIEPVEDLG